MLKYSLIRDENDQAPNGLRYLRVGGRGFCLGAGKTRSQKMLENAAESHASGARFVGWRFCHKEPLDYS